MSLSVKARLIGVLSGLSLSLLAIAGLGFYALTANNAAIIDVHDDGIVPMEQLKIVSDMYAVNVVDTSHKVRNGGMSWEAGAASLDAATKEIKAQWQNYSALHHSAAERAIIADLAPLFAAADGAMRDMRGIFSDKNQAALDDFVLNRLYQSVDPIAAAVGKLIDLTIAESHETFSAAETLEHATEVGLLILIAMGVVIVVAGVIVTLGIVRHLSNMTEVMARLAGGDTAAVIPAVERKDEIGAMAKAVQVFKDNMIETERMRAQQEEMKRQAEIDKKAALNKLADEFEANVKEIVQTVSAAANELQATAQSMSGTADTTSARTTAVAAASEEASSNVQTVAAATEELSASVGEIGRQVNESSHIANSAVQEAEKTNAQMRELSDAAQRIGDVVALITDIASQTNLLALNATIEAARAGEAGKGFAVVASEVKNLATQTAKATEEISAKIAEMQTVTNGSVAAIGAIGQTIARINDIAANISIGVGEQLAATGEIANNVQQAAAGTQEVTTNIVEVTQLAGETGAAATQVLSAAGELARQSGSLQSNVVDFIARVRAA
ncbi:MAG: methyl-accepting chemotaxis protein [Alphaproteobacteria bacterium]